MTTSVAIALALLLHANVVHAQDATPSQNPPRAHRATLTYSPGDRFFKVVLDSDQELLLPFPSPAQLQIRQKAGRFFDHPVAGPLLDLTMAYGSWALTSAILYYFKMPRLLIFNNIVGGVIVFTIAIGDALILIRGVWPFKPSHEAEEARKRVPDDLS
jgi:hypothetical protein